MRSLRRPAAPRMVAVAIALAAAIFGAVGGHVGAGAASPSRHGWWKVGLPVADVGIGGVGNLKDPQAADVPDGGLLVQGGASADKPAAYAALAFDLGRATVGGPLRLVPAETAASVPGSKLIACPLNDASFKPADGGSIAEAPAYTCSSAVNATVDSSGAYVFDIAGLPRGDSLAVAILPSAPTDRVVFARPGDDALPVNESPGGADVSAGLTQPPDLGSLGTGDAGALPASDFGGSTGVSSPAPSFSDTPAASAPAAAGAPAASVLPEARPATAARSTSTSYVPYILVALTGLAAVLWIGAGASQEDTA